MSQIICRLAVVFVVLGTPLSVAARDVHVAQTGDDGSPGTKKQPLASIPKAVAAMRGAGPGTIWVGPGEYYLETGLAFDVQHAGTAEQPLVVRGTEPGQVRLTGARTVSHLRPLTADEAQKLPARHLAVLAPEIARVMPSAIRACRAGVGRVHFLDRQADGAMLMEFFTRDGVGTVMTSAPLARLRDARIDDVGAVLGLIEPLEADGTLVKRGRERLEIEITRFSVVEHDGVIVGCAAIYPFSTEKSAELACLAVMPDFRRSGYGDQLRSHIEARAKKLKLKRLFVLTTRTAHWFIERGFVAAGVDELPAARRELYNLQRRSKVLVKAL